MHATKLLFNGANFSDSASGSRIKVASLGGCFTLAIAESLDMKTFELTRHFWRRPTIALMSPSINLDTVGKSISSHFDLLPQEIRTYFHADLTKAHLGSIKAAGAEILILDLARDLVTGVIEIGPNAFVIDLSEGVGIMDGLTAESFPASKFRQIFGGVRQISWWRDWDEFFNLWKISFDRFMEEAGKNFRDIVIVECYYTNKLSFDGTYQTGDSTIQARNEKLLQLYGHVARSHSTARLIGMPERFFVTGELVRWGPSRGHYTDEIYLLLAEKIKAAVLSQPFAVPERIVEHMICLSERRRLLESKLKQHNITAPVMNDLFDQEKGTSEQTGLSDDLLPADFDPIFYLERHPDVRNAGVDPKMHYIHYGRLEGRVYKLANPGVP